MAIVAGDISAANLATLKTDGWLIHHVPTIQNPSLWTQNKGGKGFPPRFWGVYTKLTIFNLTQYDRVVYLDADTIASRNVDELFLCDGFCAVLRHSERFNSGVMVLEPSAATFADMLHRIYDTPSYTGGDQGFLNEYFSEFSNSPLFLPRAGKLLSQSASSWKDSKGRRLARLPTEYNADLGLYVANSNRWMIPKDQLGIIHYTLATFKPWQWWSSWILSENGRRWQELRARLPAGADGGGDGGSNRSSSRSTLQGLLGPLVLAVLIVRRWCWTRGLGACWRCWMGCGERVGGRRSAVVGIYARNEQPGGVRLPLGFRPLAAVAGAGSLGIAVVVAVGRIVPPQSKPRIGWLMAYEWVTLLTLLCYYWGQRRPGKSVFSVSCHRCEMKKIDVLDLFQLLKFFLIFFCVCSLKKDEGFACGESSRPWAESLVGTAGLVATLSLLPWWTDIFG